MSRNVGIGKVYTTRIQKPHFCGLGVYDPNKVFFVPDENGKVYVDDVLCSIITSENLGPVGDMTLRFKFSDLTYNPVDAGVGTSGTWKKVNSNPNIWDWSRTNASWNNIFNNAFNDEGNFVEIIDAGVTSDVITFQYAFCNNISLISACSIDTSNATSLYAMFYNDVNLENVGSYDLSSATDVSSMFRSTKIKTVTLSNTSNVSSFSWIFGNNSNIEELPYFDTTNATSFHFFAANCSNIKNIPLYKTDNVSNCTAAFMGCTKVESGALALYQQMSRQTNPPTSTSNCFSNCGRDTTTGAAELAMIPEAWGGNFVTYITLGNKRYNFVEWNGLYVLTEDLTWDVGTHYINQNAPEPIGYYYANTTENVSEIHSALRAAGYGDWRVPTAEDWTRLINEPTITLPCTEKWERERGITKLMSNDEQFRSVFPDHALLNESGIGLNPCRIATSTADQFDRANYLEDADTAHNVIMRYNGGYTVVTANYGSTAGACVRLVKDAV